MTLNPRQRRQRVLAAPEATDRSRDLRSHMSLPEVLLWKLLSRRRAAGLPFARQRPLGPSIADFSCHEALLIVEVDGQQHLTRAAHDRTRDRWMRSNEYAVLRVPAREVLRDPNAVVEWIVRVARERIFTLTGQAHEAPALRVNRGNKVTRPRRAAPLTSASRTPPPRLLGWTPSKHFPLRRGGGGSRSPSR